MPATIEANPAYLRKTSRKWRATNIIQMFVGGAAITEILLEITGSINAARGFVDALVAFVGPYSWTVRLLMLWAIFCGVQAIRHLMLQDVEEGRAVPSGVDSVPAERTIKADWAPETK